MGIHQDARLYAGLFDGTESADTASPPAAGLCPLRGKAVVNGHPLTAGDALLYRDEPQVTVDSGEAAELLVLDLPRQP